VIDPGFEYADPEYRERRTLDNVVYELLRRTPKLVSTDVQLLLREHYETMFGLHDHKVDKPDEPFALVAMHAGEDNLTHSLLYERVRLFKLLEVHKHYGLSLKEFFEMPPYLTEEILNQCATEKNRSDAATIEAWKKLQTQNAKP
jgi:hypothetical protein